jgi:S1-C subfamily serine protease
MFEDACKLYWNILCSVGDSARVYGQGCMLTPNHAITALHVIKNQATQNQRPTIMKHDGLFKCEVLLQSDQFDIAVLLAKEKIKSCELDQPIGYPTIASSTPFLGATIGYIGRLHVNAKEGERTHTVFSQAVISYLFNDKKKDGMRCALSGGIIQGGFSGGPVFNQKSELVGLIVMSQQFPIEMGHPEYALYTLPIMSPLIFLKKDIESIIG